MGSVCTESNSKSAWVDLNRAAAASSLARVACRSPAAKALVPPRNKAAQKKRKNLRACIGFVSSSSLGWTPKSARRKPERQKRHRGFHLNEPGYGPEVVLAVRPHLP